MRFHVLGRILAAQALSSVGTAMSAIALAFMVNELTGSVLHMGGVMGAAAFPLVITSLVGGAFLDRFSAKKIMVIADLARAGLVFSVPYLAQESISLIYVISVLIGVCTAIFNPAQIKLVGDLAEPRYLVRANSYLSVSRDGAELIGYLIGGVLVATIGYTLAFTVDSASYLLSALLLFGLPSAVGATGQGARVGQLIVESPRVFVKLWRIPRLRTNLLLAVFPLMAVMMSAPNSYGLALDVFGKGSQGLAALEVLTASGLIVGGVVISRMVLRGDKNRYVFLSFIAIAACFVGIYFSPNFWLSIALMGVAGAFNVGLFVPSITMFQETPAGGEKGRLIAVRAGFGQFGSTGGLVLGGILGQAVGITRLFLVAGIMTIGLSLVVYIPSLIGAHRRTEAAWSAAVRGGSRRATARAAAREAAHAGEGWLSTSAAGRNEWSAALAEEARADELSNTNIAEAEA